MPHPELAIARTPLAELLRQLAAPVPAARVRETVPPPARVPGLLGGAS